MKDLTGKKTVKNKNAKWGDSRKEELFYMLPTREFNMVYAYHEPVGAVRRKKQNKVGKSKNV